MNIKNLLCICLLFFVYSKSLLAQTNPDSLLKAIFLSESEPLNTELTEVEVSPAVAASIRILGEKGYFIGVDDGVQTLQFISFQDLEKRDFDVPGVLKIIDEDAASIKASIRLYLNLTVGGQPVLEAANVYIFVYGNKSSGKIIIEKFEVDYRGAS